MASAYLQDYGEDDEELEKVLLPIPDPVREKQNKFCFLCDGKYYRHGNVDIFKELTKLCEEQIKLFGTHQIKTLVQKVDSMYERRRKDIFKLNTTEQAPPWEKEIIEAHLRGHHKPTEKERVVQDSIDKISQVQKHVFKKLLTTNGTIDKDQFEIFKKSCDVLHKIVSLQMSLEKK